MKAVVATVTDLPNGNRMSFDVAFVDGSTGVEVYNLDVDFDDTITEKGLKTLIEAQVMARVASEEYDMDETDIVYAVPNQLFGLTQAAIADAPTDAPTNRNVITTLLGTLTGGVNDDNVKQNEIATKLNTLLAGLRSAGVIAE